MADSLGKTLISASLPEAGCRALDVAVRCICTSGLKHVYLYLSCVECANKDRLRNTHFKLRTYMKPCTIPVAWVDSMQEYVVPRSPPHRSHHAPCTGAGAIRGASTHAGAGPVEGGVNIYPECRRWLPGPLGVMRAYLYAQRCTGHTAGTSHAWKT